MIRVIKIQLDEQQLKEIYLDEINKRLKEIDKEISFWDTKELKRQTNMSWNTIQDNFFHDPDFPKFKSGQKWYFPAYECKVFLRNWALKQQKKYKFFNKEAM